MEHWFESATKSLATGGLSRRDALTKIALAGLASLCRDLPGLSGCSSSSLGPVAVKRGGLFSDSASPGCIWLSPEAVVRVEFAEWTGANKLRHTRYVAMRFDKDPRKVVREEN